MLFNFHTHCRYCDGKGDPQEFIDEAVKQSFTAFGFSPHAPLPFENKFSIKEDILPIYIAEIQQLIKLHPQLPISYGLECDYIPHCSNSFQYFKEKYAIQYLIGGVHLVKYQNQLWFIDGPNKDIYDEGLNKIFANDIQLAVKTYFYQLFEMIENECFDIVAHFDKIKMHNQNRYFREDEKWYQNYIEEALHLIKSKNLVVEINTRGIYKKRCDTFYPSPWIIKKMQQMDIPITISMDAHQSNEISLGFNDAKQCAINFGYKEIVLLINGRQQILPLI